MNLVEYASFLVGSLVSDAEMIKIQSFEEDNQTVLEIMVPEQDMGAVIGRAGRVANSLRILLQAYAYLHEYGKIRVNIEAF